MEEKRKDTLNQPPASSTTAYVSTLTKPSEAMPADEAPSSRRRGGGQKRKAGSGSGGNASTPQTTSSKRQAREKPSAVNHAPIHNGPCTRARQFPNANAAGSASVVASSDVVKNEAVAPRESGGGEAVKAAKETSVVEEDMEALEAKIEAEYEVIKSRGVNAHAVPIPAGWFSWTKVHLLEERALPSFFNGKSENRTPEIYMEIRNWIMKKFHANPNAYIELKDLSEFLVGELDARQEVMELLDHWGLINYHPFPESDTPMVDTAGDGEAKMNSLLEKLYCFETEQPFATVIPRTNVTTVTTPSVASRLFPESAIAEELVKPEGPSVEYHCNSCSADCSRKRYHCQKQADFDLCSECFNNGKFDSDMSPMDFIVMEPAEAAGASGGMWTDQETLLLLEALELYKENWNEIAEHVATKTKAQCILHFVQMPIEDTFVDGDDEIYASPKENADPASANNDSSSPKDAPQTTESKTGADENQPESSPMEISKPEDGSELKIGEESRENCALKALKEAFEAVGYLPTPGCQFSFAEAGNPVMALAALLVRLVEPNVATALTHSSLKSISGNSSSLQLAAKHCFILEDPPDDKKKSADSDRAVAEKVEQDAQKDKKQNEEKQKEERSNSILDGGDLSNDHYNEKARDAVREEKELFISPDDGCTEKSETVINSDVIGTHEEGGLVSLNESDNPNLPKDLAAGDAKESNDVTPKAEIRSSSAVEMGDRASDVIRTHEEGSLVSLDELINPDLPKHQAARAAKESDDLTPKEEISSSSSKDPGDRTSEEGPSQCTEAIKDAVMVPDSVPSGKKEPEQLITSNSIAENGRNTGEEEKEDSKKEKQDLSKTKNDDNIDKMKRAAVTALSAAAVKAKLLADQEENQIRQLATLLIEKQLHKLETKFAFFNEMESVVMSVREQMERSKQRLYQERAQIIAARLGLPASSSRPMQQSLPINRVAMGFANSAAKPPVSMISQRPPISRSMMTLAPSTSNTFVPTTAPGNPVRPTNQDRLPSFGTK